MSGWEGSGRVFIAAPDLTVKITLRLFTVQRNFKLKVSKTITYIVVHANHEHLCISLKSILNF